MLRLKRYCTPHSRQNRLRGRSILLHLGLCLRCEVLRVCVRLFCGCGCMLRLLPCCAVGIDQCPPRLSAFGSACGSASLVAVARGSALALCARLGSARGLRLLRATADIDLRRRQRHRRGRGP